MHIKGAIGNAADISNKLTKELLFFLLFLSVIPSLRNTVYGFNEIEQQTDVCFLIADVIIPCSYMLLLSLVSLSILALPVGKRVNSIDMFFFHQVEAAGGNKKKSKAPKSSGQMNMRGVYLHLLGDALGSVIVIIAALVIKYFDGEWTYYVDPVMR